MNSRGRLLEVPTGLMERSTGDRREAFSAHVRSLGLPLLVFPLVNSLGFQVLLMVGLEWPTLAFYLALAASLITRSSALTHPKAISGRVAVPAQEVQAVVDQRNRSV